MLQIFFSAYHGMEIGEGSEASRDVSLHAVSVRDLEIWRPWPCQLMSQSSAAQEIGITDSTGKTRRDLSAMSAGVAAGAGCKWTFV
jgi:hypothetical protein